MTIGPSGSPASRPDAAAESRSLNFGAVILAAGASRRLGRPKQLVPFAGKPLVVRAVEAAIGGGADPVVVTLGSHAGPVAAALEGQPAILVDNPGWEEGMAASIRTGLEALLLSAPGIGAVLISPCDLPALDADVVLRLRGALVSGGKSVASARFSGRNAAPAIFLRRHFEALARLTGDRGARDLLNSNAGDITAVDLPALARDIDTPADLDGN